MPLFYKLKSQGIVDDPKKMKAWPQAEAMVNCSSG
jgi:hypothetical protein